MRARLLLLGLVLLLVLLASRLLLAGGLPVGPISTAPQSSALAQAPAAAPPAARGYLITPGELEAIERRAEGDSGPYRGNLRAFFAQSSLGDPEAWTGQASIAGSPACSDGRQRDAAGNRIPRGPRYLVEGGRLVYAKMLAAHLSEGARAEAYARNARARILDLTDTTDWGGDLYSGDNQCILYLSWYLPSFVMAADLLEPLTAIWTPADKRAFQAWLAKEAYPKIAWASRARTNNWGSGGSYGAAMIADYLWDSGLTLEEREPKARRLSPAQAYREHTAEQLSRMSTVVAPRDREDSRCLPFKGIQPSGGIPDELRRADIPNSGAMCSADHLPRIDGGYSAAYTYQMTHVEALVAHAELALRRGDRSLYDNAAPDGSGSILRAIQFVIDNPAASYDWDEHRRSMLFVAYRYYRDPAIRAQLRRDGESLRSGDVVTFAQLTHDFAATEDPGPPPVTGWTGEAQPAPVELGAGFDTSGGVWELRDGVYALSSPQRGQIGRGQGNKAIYRQPLSGDFQLSARAQVVESGTSFNDLVLIFAYRDPQNYAFVSLNESNDRNTSGIFALADGVQTEIADITAAIRSNVWHEIRLDKIGSLVRVQLDGAPVGEASSPAFGDGRVGLATFNDAAFFSDLALLPAPRIVREEFAAEPAQADPLGGVWAVEGGAYTLRTPLRGESGRGLANIALYGEPVDGDMLLSVRARARESGSGFNDLALVLDYRGPRDYTFVSFNERNDGATSGVFRLADGAQTELADIAAPIRAGAWHTVRLEREGAALRVLLDDVVVAALSLPEPGVGRVGFASLNDSVAFDDLQIELPARPIYPLAN